MSGPWEQYQKAGKAQAAKSRPQVSRSELLRRTAKQAVAEGKVGTGNAFFDALSAGVRRNLFGLPERAAAAYDYYVGGTPAKSYDEALQLQRDITDAQWDKSKTGGILGSIAGAIGGGGAAGKVAGAGGNFLARIAGAGKAATAARRTGQLVQAAQKLKKGQTARNAGKLALAGGASGAAQALGEGSDVTTGAVAGTVGGAALPFAGKLAKGTIRKATRPFSKDVGRALDEVIGQSPDEIEAALASLEGRTGRSMPVASVLNPRDAAVIQDRIIRNSPEAAAAVRAQAGQALNELPDAMRAHVANAASGAMDTNASKLALAREADMDRTMSRIGDRTLDISQGGFDELERDLLSQIGRRTPSIAERFAAREASPNLSEFNPLTGEGAAGPTGGNWWERPTELSLREIDSLRRSLRKMAKGSEASNPLNSQDAANAARRLTEYARSDPDYAAALDLYARQGDRIRGFDLAKMGKRAGDLGDTQQVRNVMSPEGLEGQAAGARARLSEQVGATPSAAVRMASELASGGNLTRPGSGLISEQLGNSAAASLRDAGAAESEAIRTMLKNAGVDVASDKPEKFDDPEILSTIGAVLSGNALLTTKARFLNYMLARTPFNEQTAAKVADMLFDPKQSRQVLKFLRDRKFDTGRAMKAALAGGNLSAAATAPETPEGIVPNADMPDASGDLPNEAPPSNDALPWEQYQGSSDTQPYSPVDLSQESPEFQDFVGRMIGQESGGNQFDENGNPLRSSAGAIGVAQVMPGTAPEAAQLAGLPWDEQAYYSDPEYNKALGVAYLGDMLRRFGGNTALAAAAYNAGPGAVERALRQGGDNWLAYLPSETQNYVQNVS